ncbi:DUF2804 domain-containing protein [Clostridium sp. CCUG 7971]|uniref:DUF2804 domain-containing protein n=1 Tax=Clostridium sp. CCUG 7971 TaxID=2811414 RepID=UPI001ABBE0E3|nr:DUF2804 domain-containing protein [Clostridium sp. CCUG 7971]MBO3445944.1 DUF2804 domain-containing protein [Clostridium sp. CCUG 7971]
MEELKGKNYICSKEGTINHESIGWSRNVFKNCDIETGFFRKKIWNHYMWMNEKFICTFALVKLDYVGVIYVDFYDIRKNNEIHKCIYIPLCNGIIIHNNIGSYAHFQNKQMYANIIRVSNSLNIILKWDEIDIDASIEIEDESLNVLVPWSDKLFHYTSKQFPLKSSGYIQIGEEQCYIDEAMMFIDYGRGIWEREKSWYWLTCGFEKDNKRIGLNLGAKWTDNTGVNENCIKINNKILKINSDVEFNKIDENNWGIKSINSDEVDLVFDMINLNEKISSKYIVKSDMKQRIGILNGIVKLNNEEIEFENNICWFEDHYAKW